MSERFYWWKQSAPPQAELEWIPYSLQGLLEEVRDERFPHRFDLPSVQFARRLWYATIYMYKDNPFILVSGLFNHPETPRIVLKSILTHELLHIDIPGREVDGEYTTHPPEFWEKEGELTPERDDAWNWINWNFLGQTVTDEKREATRLKLNAYRNNRWGKRMTLGEIKRDFLSVFNDSDYQSTISNICDFRCMEMRQMKLILAA